MLRQDIRNTSVHCNGRIINATMPIKNNCAMWQFSKHLFDHCAVISCVLNLYLPLLAACVGVRLPLSIAKSGGRGGGIIVWRHRGIAFPAYLASSHSQWLLGHWISPHTKEVIKRESWCDYHSAHSQKLKKKEQKKKSRPISLPFAWVRLN